jgi:hypothetical protein
MSTRRANEKRYKQWTETDTGGRIYVRKVLGQYRWYALYIKEVDSKEDIIHFRQEIYDEQDILVEVHEKYPIDKGHQKAENQ